jgi:HAD superfamily hydrolase (TIGR01509 family)
VRFQLPTSHYSAFIFDCDGTLADSMPLHFRAWRAALSRYHAPFEFDWPLFVSRAGMTQQRTVEELNRQFGSSLDPTAVADAQQSEFDALIDEVLPITEVVDYARSVAHRHPVAVASGGERSAVERTLELIGVADLFRTVVVAADVERGKPAPDLFLLAAARLKVSPETCLVFEDSVLGIAAADAAGMGSVLVRADPPLPRG